MPVAGLVRLRRHLFGRQSAHGTISVAKRAYPYKGVPSVDLQWTDPELDAGALDMVAAPYRGPGEFTADLTNNALGYNSLVQILSGFFGGGETPSGVGTAKTWAFAPASDTVDAPDVYTYQFGDDVLTDWYQFPDGIIESFEITGPSGLGPLTASVNWRFGGVKSTGSTDSPVSGTVPTASLDLDTNEALIYLKDGGISIASDPADLDTSLITGALHSFVLRGSGDLDLKRYADADQSYEIDAYARASRAVEIEATWAKTADIVGTGSESDAWMSDAAVTRYIKLEFTSTVVAETGTPDVPYSWTTIAPMRYYTRTEGEEGGNSTVVLTGHVFFDAAEFAGLLTSDVVCTLASTAL